MATVMIAILAASVALAWLTTGPAAPPLPGGAEIISKLADDTLDEYWNDSHSDSWFIVLKPNLKPIGWQMLSKGRQAEGVFSGGMVSKSAGDLPDKSTWRISADLSEGLYVARGSDNKGRIVETRITLTDNEVSVVRSSGDQKLAATAARPDNYLPEGVFPLALRLVAERGQEATVKMIFDEIAVIHGAVNFINARLIPQGRNFVRVEYSGRGPLFSIVYQLDSAHEVSRYEYPAEGTIYLRCEKTLVTETFRIPDDGPVIKSE